MDSGVIESRTGSTDLDRFPLRLIKEKARVLECIDLKMRQTI